VRRLSWAPPIGIAILLAGIFLGLFGSTVAQAATTYAGAGELGGEAFSNPSRIAVDDATGNVLVTDTGTNRVDVYSSAGDGAALLGSYGQGELAGPEGIAVDQSNGDVYVADAGNSRVVRYTSDGAPTPTYTRDLSYASPSLGSGAGQIGSFASALAVDPTNRDLLIADTGNLRVSRFTASGAFVSSFNGEAGQGAAFSSLFDLTADSEGHVYVVADGTTDSLFGATSGSRVQRFASDGTAGEVVGADSLGEALRVVFDPATDNLIVATGGAAEEGAWGVGKPNAVHVFNEGEAIDSFANPGGSEGVPVGLAIDGGPSGRLYSLMGHHSCGVCYLGTVKVKLFAPTFAPLRPSASIGAVSEVTKSSAQVTGTVNPRGEAGTHYHFEYSMDNGASWTPSPEEEAGTGEAPEPVQAELSGLEPNTAYQVRLVVSTPFFTTTSDATTFTTAVAPPIALTDVAGDITATSATLYGRVNPLGLVTTYHFEYGPTAAYGLRTPATDAQAGNGRIPRVFSQPALGLTPGATYHFRIVASSTAGASAGADHTFLAGGGGALERAYEQVSPVEKGGMIVKPTFGHQAAPDGNSIAYMTKGAFKDAKSSPLFPKYLGVRNASGWPYSAIDPPHMAYRERQSNFGKLTLAVSRDLSHSIVYSDLSLDGEGVDGKCNLYMQDNIAGTQTAMATGALQLCDELSGVISEETIQFFISGTDDFSTVAFNTAISLMPDVAEGLRPLYKWSDGKLSVVSLDPEGAPQAMVRQTTRARTSYAVSSDGSRISFTGRSPEGEPAVYQSVGDDIPTPLSVSHRPGDDPSLVMPGQFRSASRDGRFVFFVSEAALTPDAEEDTNQMYRLDTQENQLVLVSAGDFFESSADGSYAYIEALREIRVWHDGTVSQVAEFANPPGRWYASPNGKFFSFFSEERLTEYDNEGMVELYLYDADAAALSCVSCPGVGVAPTAPVDEFPSESLFGYWPRTVTNQGQAFFDSPEQLVSSDVNGQPDVYEYSGGQVRLISTGKDDVPSYFDDVSEDGNNVFFTTAARLVAQDTDDLSDLYDARVGGGIPSQNQAGSNAGCAGEDCRGAVAASSSPLSVGSESNGGSGGAATGHRKRCGHGRHRVTVKGKQGCRKRAQAGGKRRAPRGSRVHTNGRQGR
jgi:hypothetical protein